MSKLATTLFLALVSFNCAAQQLTDPTMPANYSAAKAVSTVATTQYVIADTDKKLILNSTIVASKHKVAIINGVQFKVGDEMSDGAIVKNITHQQVKLLRKDGEEITLSLQKSFIRDLKSASSEATN